MSIKILNGMTCLIKSNNNKGVSSFKYDKVQEADIAAFNPQKREHNLLTSL